MGHNQYQANIENPIRQSMQRPGINHQRKRKKTKTKAYHTINK
jgi:hypothetical protein